MQDVTRIPLAIVGMACRLPGADNLDEYWSLLTEGRSGLGELPPDRFDRSKHFDPTPGVRTKSYTALGGVVSPRPFDLNGYPLPQWLIETTAQCHLNMCEVAARAFEHAGWDPYQPPYRNAGVYIGHAPPMSQMSKAVYARQVAHTAEYLRQIPEFDTLVGGQSDAVIQEVVAAVRSEIAPDDPILRLRAQACLLPALLSRQFSFDGPSMAFDAACASSLRALGHGARALQLGEIDVAMVGSASYCHADTLVLFSKAQSVSATGSRPFDDDADGLIAAEGYVVLLLKTLDKALADCDRIHAVIRGIGISSDGKGKSLWAPRKEGQMEAVRRAYSEDVAPSDLQFIEMHATSTQVGDSTEMSALVECLAPMLPEGRRIPVGSAKANVGHTLETAGLASLVKTALALQHRTIPPQINLNRLNEKIDWPAIPFFPPTTALAWPEPTTGKPRRAAVNAFGIGGLNVHVVLEEFTGRSVLPVANRRSKPGVELRDTDDEAIAVIGIGTVLPGAHSAEEFRKILESGADQRTDAPSNRWDGDVGDATGEDRPWTIPSRRGGFITDYKFDWKKYKIPPKQVETGAMLQFMLLDAAEQAIMEATAEGATLCRERTGVIVGTSFGSEFGDKLQMGLRLSDFRETLHEVLQRRGIAREAIDQLADRYDETLLRRIPALLDETGSFTASTHASRITKTFDFMGGATAVDAGDVSALAALNAAMHMLLSGECDTMVCAAGDQSLSFSYFESLARQGILARRSPTAPFGEMTDGATPAEGACVIVLKRLKDARRDGNRIQAIIRGIGAAWDASPEAATQRAAAQALNRAGLSPSDVAAVESSAKGTRETDAEELRGIDAVYATEDRAEPVQVGAAAAQFGHCGGGSGMVSLLQAMHEVSQAEMLPVVGLAHTAVFAKDNAGRRVSTSRSPLKAGHEEGRLFAAVNSASSAGLACHVIIERPTKVAPPTTARRKTSSTKPAVPRQAWSLVRVGSSSWAELQQRLTALATSPAELTAFSTKDRVRAAIVSLGPDDLRLKCQLALERGVSRENINALFEAGVICGEVGSTRLAGGPDLNSSQWSDWLTPLAGHALSDRCTQSLLTARGCLEVLGAVEAPVFEPELKVGLVPNESGLTIVRLAGTPYDMGLQHGRALARQIRVVLRRHADLAGTRWDSGDLLDEAIRNAPEYFTPDEMDEIRGIAKGANVSPGSILAHNLRLLLDGGAGGAHFAAPGSEGRLLHGYNEDLRQALSVRDCVERVIQYRHPVGRIASILLSPVGVVGGLSGINAHGLAVSATCLLDRPAEPAAGRLLSGQVRFLLEAAENIETAIDVARRSPVGIPHTLCLTEGPTRRSCLVETVGDDLRVVQEGATLTAVNHSRDAANGPSHSRYRHERLESLLRAGVGAQFTPARAQETLRDQYDASRQRASAWPTMNTVRRVDNQISVVFDHGRGKAYVTPGPLANGHQNHFAEVDLSSITSGVVTASDASAAAPSAAATSTGHTVARAAAEPQNLFTTSEAVTASYAAAEAASSGRTCERIVLRLQKAPAQRPKGVSRWAGQSAIVLGASSIANELAAELRRRGSSPVTVIPADGTAEAAVAQLETAWQSQPAALLFLCTPHDSKVATELRIDQWTQRRSQGVLLPYRVCQRWFQLAADASLLDRSALVAVTSLGGTFGLSGRGIHVESGALTGLVKGVAMEVAIGKGIAKGFCGKSIDVAAGTSPEVAARFVCNEIETDPGASEPEVALHDGGRCVVRPVVQSVDSLPLSDLPRGAVFVVTGGARGVTAVVARELGLRYGLKLHLIGSSRKPEIADSYHQMSADDLKEVKTVIMKEALASGEKPADAWSKFEKALEIDRSLRELRAAGVDATYHGCDVSDRVAIAAVLDDIRRKDGPISGVIHGAGFERASRFEKKQIELVDRTFAAKVDGAAALMELTAKDPIRWFAAFGSVAGRFGGVGQTDYASANDMLAKLIDWYRGWRPGVAAAAFHWHAWDDVGMAVRPESAHIRKMHNIRFMPSREGADHLVNELRAGLPEGEIAITEVQYCRERFGSSTTSTEPEPAAEPVRFPLIDRIVELTPGQSITAEVVLDPANDLFLKKHLFKGRPMMPLVATLEALVEAAQLVAGPGRQPVAVRDVEILNGLRFLTDRSQTGRMRVKSDGAAFECSFTCDVVNRAGVVLKADQPYLRCVVEFSDRPQTFNDVRPPLPNTWNDIWYPDGDTVIYHGDEFRCLKRGVEENGLLWGAYTAPEQGNLAGSRHGENWIMPSALIDSGFYGSGVMLWVKYQGVVAIPAGIERIELGRRTRPGEECTGLFIDRGRDGKNALFDFVIFGDDGAVVCRVLGYKNVIVAEQPVETMKHA